MGIMHASDGHPDIFGGHQSTEIILGISSSRGNGHNLTDRALAMLAEELSVDGDTRRPIICDPWFYKALSFEVDRETNSGDSSFVPAVSEVGRDEALDGSRISRREAVRSALDDTKEFLENHASQGREFDRRILIAPADEARWIARLGMRMGLELSLPDTQLPVSERPMSPRRWLHSVGYMIDLLH